MSTSLRPGLTPIHWTDGSLDLKFGSRHWRFRDEKKKGSLYVFLPWVKTCGYRLGRRHTCVRWLKLQIVVIKSNSVHTYGIRSWGCRYTPLGLKVVTGSDDMYVGVDSTYVWWSGTGDVDAPSPPAFLFLSLYGSKSTRTMTWPLP